MDRRCNIDRLFTYTIGNTNGSTLSTNLVDTSIVYQHNPVKEEDREGGRYNRAVRGYCNFRLPNRNRCLSRSFFLKRWIYYFQQDNLIL